MINMDMMTCEYTDLLKLCTLALLQNSCWIETDHEKGGIWGFVAPMLAIIIVRILFIAAPVYVIIIELSLVHIHIYICTYIHIG